MLGLNIIICVYDTDALLSNIGQLDGMKQIPNFEARGKMMIFDRKVIQVIQRKESQLAMGINM